MPFQWGYSAAHSLIRSEFFGEVSLFSGELALPRCGRDRVSRFIGKSDTTARGPRLQVTCEVRSLPREPKRRFSNSDSRQNHKAPLHLEWRFGSCAGHWPPGTAANGILYRCYNRLPGRLSLFEGPLLWRWLLPRSVFFGLFRDLLPVASSSLAPSI